MIPEFADSIARKLAFDPRLARSVRAEVEDHLWEAATAGGSGGDAAAEQRAIASFGDARIVASQLAALWLARQGRALALAVMVLVAAVFIAMKVRVAWYALLAPAAGGAWAATAAVVLAIDRLAFLLAAVLALAAWASFLARPTRLRTFLAVSAIAMASLIVSVACDALLTALQAMGRGLGADAILPFASMALEAAGAVVVAAQLCVVARGAPMAARVLL